MGSHVHATSFAASSLYIKRTCTSNWTHVERSVGASCLTADDSGCSGVPRDVVEETSTRCSPACTYFSIRNLLFGFACSIDKTALATDNVEVLGHGARSLVGCCSARSVREKSLLSPQLCQVARTGPRSRGRRRTRSTFRFLVGPTRTTQMTFHQARSSTSG